MCSSKNIYPRHRLLILRLAVRGHHSNFLPLWTWVNTLATVFREQLQLLAMLRWLIPWAKSRRISW
jgi:hypothetical protein